jgi:hypothetical protein
MLWFDVIKPKVKIHYTKAPSLPLLVNENVHYIMKKGTIYDNATGKILDKSGQESVIIEKDKLVKIPFSCPCKQKL